MSHPKDRSGLTRGQLLRGAAAAAAGVGVAGGLAACENTTEPIAVGCEDGGRRYRARRSSSRSRSARAGCRSRAPTTASPGRSWRTTRRSPTACRRRPGATLRLFNYPDYIYPALLRRFEKRYDCKVEVATYNASDEAIAKLQSGAVDYDVIIGLSGSNIVNLMALQLLQPLNHTYLPNLAANIWPQLADPFYDRGSRYTVPYVTWSDGIGWRNDIDLGGHPGARRARGTSSGSRRSGGARSGSSTTSATGSPCRCSATR